MKLPDVSEAGFLVSFVFIGQKNKTPHSFFFFQTLTHGYARDGRTKPIHKTDAMFLPIETFAALLESMQPIAEHYQQACEVLTADPVVRDIEIEIGKISTPDDTSPLRLILSTGLYA